MFILKKSGIFIFSIVLFFLFQAHTLSQKSQYFSNADYEYNVALYLFHKQKYGPAQNHFNAFLRHQSNTYTENYTHAEFYSALCGLKLMNNDAEYLVYKFTAQHPESPKVNEAYFELARYHFHNKKNNKVLYALSHVDYYLLSNDEQAEYFFMKGYCLFNKNKPHVARAAFYRIMNVDTKYTSPATYYYAQIHYEQENYQTALQHFRRLEDDETFSSIVPYYISQILFIQEKYEEIIEYAIPLAETVTKKREAEMHKIIGLAYYRTEQYARALPYLKSYTDKTNVMSKEDWYQLGYSYYMTDSFEMASQAFENVAYGTSALHQNALYHLAECYLQLDRKKEARMAFMGASKLDFDPKIKEEALFYYALVTYEISFSPFNEAIKAFNEYLELYPRSKRADEAYHYLTLVYLNTKNYKAALESINKIKYKNEEMRKAWQRIAFYRGIELYNNLQYKEANNLFFLSLDNSQYDPVLEALAYYWSGEAYYRLQEYDDALIQYDTYLQLPISKELSEYTTCHYNLAYTYFSKKDYAYALKWYNQYEALSDKSKKDLLSDTYNRIGDCHFMLSKYDDAIYHYDKNIALKHLDVDYALYQKGLSLGLLKRFNEKITVLTTLLTEHPKSAYYDDALFELGKSYTVANQDDMAINSYNKIISDYPNSSYHSKAFLQLGLIYYNQRDNEKALQNYKKVIEGYSGTEEAENAFTGIRNIYVDMNDIEAYFAYVENLGTQQAVSLAEQDSLSYITAENIYMAGDCEKAKNNFIKYIDRFKNGRFLLNAHYYKGDCQYKNKEYDEALTSFNYIIDKPKNIFSEQALLGAATINYRNENYDAALQNYTQLEHVAEIKTNIITAKAGKMRCYYNTNKYNEAIEVSTKLLILKKVPETLQREANYIAGKSYIEIRDIETALDHLLVSARDLSTEPGAESKYLVADIYSKMGKIVEAKIVIYDFIDKGTPHEYWLARAFILIAELFAETGEEFQAIYSLQSIIEEYEIPDDGIIQTAKAKKLIILDQMKEKGIEFDDPDLEIKIE